MSSHSEDKTYEKFAEYIKKGDKENIKIFLDDDDFRISNVDYIQCLYQLNESARSPSIYDFLIFHQGLDIMINHKRFNTLIYGSLHATLDVTVKHKLMYEFLLDISNDYGSELVSEILSRKNSDKDEHPTNSCVYVVTAVVCRRGVEITYTSGISLTESGAKKLCKNIAMSGGDIIRAYLTAHELDENEFMGNEDSAFMVCNSQGLEIK